MTYPLSRFMSAATATYGVYALAQPRHLGDAVDPKHAADYDLLAQTYGARDLAISSVGVLAKSERAVGAAMAGADPVRRLRRGAPRGQGARRADPPEGARRDLRLGHPEHPRAARGPSPGAPAQHRHG